MLRRLLSRVIFVLMITALAAVLFPQNVRAFSDGDGSEGDPYTVETCEDLQDISNDLDAHYLQTVAVIDCSVTNPSSEDFNDTGTWADERGFDPIGNSSTPFTGSFNGGEYAITNLYINRPSADFVGLFGYANGAQFTAVSVNHSDIIGDRYVGTIVGSVDGESENQSSLIDINSSNASVQGSADIGGLVGTAGAYTRIDYSDANDVDVTGTANIGGAIGSTYGTEVERSASTGLVTGTDSTSRIGGFVGGANCGSEFVSSSSTVDVTGETNTRVGGFAGSATINCEGGSTSFLTVAAYGDVVGDSQVGGMVGYASYASFNHISAVGTVTANDSVGGLVGVMIGSGTGEETSGTLQESFSTGAVSGGADVGGLIGVVSGGLIINSYTRSNVEGSAQPGGFIGEVISDGEDRLAIIDSFAANTVMAGVYPQGFIGDDDAELTDITNSFWDKEYDNVNTSYGGDGKTTAEMKSVPTFTTLLGDDSWDFGGAWGMSTEINDGYPCLRYFEDEDLCVYTVLSADDDLNGDDIDDNFQDNLSGYTNSYTGKKVLVDVGEGCEITVDDTVSESSLSKQDPDYVYVSGMFEWEAYCGVMGATTTIRLLYYDISMENLVVRKYTESSQQYSTIEGATLSEETINGHTVTVATYEISDGGSLDDDGEENGSIVDPAGVGQLASTLVDDSGQPTEGDNLANTGQSQGIYLAIAISLLILGLGVTFFALKPTSK